MCKRRVISLPAERAVVNTTMKLRVS